MKRILSFLLAAAMGFLLAACSQAAGSVSASEQDRTATEAERPAGEEFAEGPDQGYEGMRSGNVLVAYFSWADNAILAEDVDAVSSPSVLPPGNVQQLAAWVQEATGGDIFPIRVTEPYPSDWGECLERANGRRGEDHRSCTGGGDLR